MLNHLGDGCFYLQDFEMDLVEIPYLIKFLQSKVVSVAAFLDLCCFLYEYISRT